MTRKIPQRLPRSPRRTKTPSKRAAYFLSLSIEHIRCFGDRQTIDFSDGNGKPAQWTVLLGNNGVGKTTILQALVCMMPRWSAVSRPAQYVAKGAFDHDVRPFVQRENDDFSLSMTLASGKSLSDAADRFNHSEWRISLRPEWETGWSFAASIDFDPVCYAYGASRRMGEGALTEAAGDDPTATLFDESASLRNAEEWLLQADYAVSKANGAQGERAFAEARLEKIKDILKAILPDVTDVVAVAPSTEGARPRVEVMTPDGLVPVRDLSLGYRTMIAWMVDFASRQFERYPHSENPLAEPAIVLVDEIDLHLHPSWQRKLLAWLTERCPNTQFIATAHSPLVVQAAAEANIVVLKRQDGQVRALNDVATVRNWRIDQILTSELFDLPSAHPPAEDALREEREQILGKRQLTQADERRLRDIEGQIVLLSAGESRADLEAMDLIRRAAQRLKGTPTKRND